MDLLAPHADPGDRRAAWTAGGLLALVIAYSLARGMPWPQLDDLFFMGAGIDLARTGELVNHGIDGWLAAFGTHKFYVQLPFPSYSLALWFRLFGVHTASVLAYQWLWYAAGMWGLVRTLGRFGLALGLRLFLAAVYLRIMFGYGYRPDSEAIALLFLGLALADTAGSFPQRLGAMILLGFSCSSYPIEVALAAPFGVALAWLTLPPDLDGRGRWPTLVRAWVFPAGLAAAVTFLVFLAMIRGDLTAFLAVFNAHRHLRASSDHPFAQYLAMNLRYREALVTLPFHGMLVAVGAWVALRWRRVEAGTRTLVAACVAASLGCILLYAARASEFIGLLSYFALGSVISLQSLRRWRWPLALTLVALYLASGMIGLLGVVLQRFPDPSAWRAARAAATASGKRLVLDHSTARYVFDYHFPPDTLYSSYIRLPTPDRPLTLAEDKKPDAIWVVSVKPGVFLDLPPAFHDYPRLQVGGHEFRSVALCPDAPLIIP